MRGNRRYRVLAFLFALTLIRRTDRVAPLVSPSRRRRSGWGSAFPQWRWAA
jgi:hypothetical protein